MELIACPVCGTDNSTVIWSKDGAHYMRCSGCTLVYENPRLTEKELVEFYSRKSYFVHDGQTPLGSGYQDYLCQCTKALCEEYFAIVERYATRRTGRFCDVGCGLGGAMKIAEGKGWESFGVEVSSWAAQEARKDGLKVFEGSLLDASYPSDHFDAVSMFDVLEHLATPRQYLQEIKRILRPGGVLIVETPNIDGFFARHLYKSNAALVKPRAHICLYGPRSGSRLMRDAGFSSFKVMTFPYTRRISLGYIKDVVVSRLRWDRPTVQLTVNDSLRVVSWK